MTVLLSSPLLSSLRKCHMITMLTMKKLKIIPENKFPDWSLVNWFPNRQYIFIVSNKHSNYVTFPYTGEESGEERRTVANTTVIIPWGVQLIISAYNLSTVQRKDISFTMHYLYEGSTISFCFKTIQLSITATKVFKATKWRFSVFHWNLTPV